MKLFDLLDPGSTAAQFSPPSMIAALAGEFAEDPDYQFTGFTRFGSNGDPSICVPVGGRRIVRFDTNPAGADVTFELEKPARLQESDAIVVDEPIKRGIHSFCAVGNDNDGKDSSRGLMPISSYCFGVGRIVYGSGH